MQSNQPSVFAHTVNKPQSVQLQQRGYSSDCQLLLLRRQSRIRVRSIFPVPTKMQLMPSFGVRVALGSLSACDVSSKLESYEFRSACPRGSLLPAFGPRSCTRQAHGAFGMTVSALLRCDDLGA